MFVGIFIAVSVIALFMMGMNIYNGLVSLRYQVERSWANIDVILKQRYDEIPQLVQVIEQYAGYENGVLQSLAKARSQYGQANTISEKIDASKEMSLALKGIFAIGEAYPQLKASENFNQLQSRISQLESQIADRRESYNECVTNFNTRLEQFPDIFAARLLNYQAQQMFKVSAEERSAPNLKMNLPKFGQSA